MSTYSVRRGDTLSALARKYHTTVKALAKDNNIKNANMIRVGQQLKVNKGGAGAGRPGHPVDGFDHKPAGQGGPAGGRPTAGGRPAAGGTGGAAPTGQVTGPTGPAPAGGRDVTVQQLRQIMPNLSQAKAEQYLPHLNRAMAEAGINTPKRQAAFLAQLAHESGQFRYMEEIASGSAYEGRRDLGNTQPGDGTRFKGRGPIQLTGRANYEAAGRALGLDLVNNPRQAASPEVGFRTAAWFWNTRNLNNYADSGNFREVTRRINGGYNGLADRQQFYSRALQVLGG